MPEGRNKVVEHTPDGKGCSKCGKREFLFYPGYYGTYGGGSHLSFGDKTEHSVPVSRYVCSSCGHIEQWVDDPMALKHLKAMIVSPPEKGVVPYRRY